MLGCICFHSHGVAQNGWFIRIIREHPTQMVSMNRGTPIAGWFMRENPSING